MTDRRRAYRAGHQAEWLAAMALRAKGYRILAQRYRTPVGEIDIVARRGGTVVIVEVKQRGDLAEGLDAVRPRQLQRIARAAEAYVATHRELASLEIRFDVMVVLPWRWPRHIIDAWRP